MRLLSLFLICFLLFTACKRPKKGALSPEEKSRLERLAESELETEEKFHELGKYIATVMKEALSMDADSLMIAHLQEFSTENKDALEMLSAEIDFWFKYMDEEERTYFIMRLLPMDYAKNLKTYEARFKKRTRHSPEYHKYLDRITRNIEIRK